MKIPRRRLMARDNVKFRENSFKFADPIAGALELEQRYEEKCSYVARRCNVRRSVFVSVSYFVIALAV
jgi:hypothetical protein